jgi:WbqC-like protein family
MKKVLIESQYLPSVAYFALIAQADYVVIERCEFFEKQTFRNRCQIQTANKKLDLSVPVHHQGKKITIDKLTIDYIQKWQNTHWRSIQTAYQNAPFFEYYSKPLQEIIYSNIDNLIELNSQLLTICLKFLQIDTTIEFSKIYDKRVDSGIFDARSMIHPKKDLSTLGWFTASPYYQIFGKDFAKNLSILDLLFNEGPMALAILKSSIVIKKNY